MQNQEQLQRQQQQQPPIMTSAFQRDEVTVRGQQVAAHDLSRQYPPTAAYSYPDPAERDTSPANRTYYGLPQPRIADGIENPAFVHVRDRQIYSTGSPLGGGLRRNRPATAKSPSERRY